jgi:hypothetical protein
MLERHSFNEQVIRSVVPPGPGVFMLIDVHGDITLVGRSDCNLADSLSEYLPEFEEHELIAAAEPEEFIFRSFATPLETYLQESEWRWLNPMLTRKPAPAIHESP